MICAASMLAWGGDPAKFGKSPAVPRTSGACEPIKPIPVALNVDAGKIALGKMLFHDARLSRNNTISCASCHDLGKGGTDRKRRPTGIDQSEGAIGFGLHSSALAAREMGGALRVQSDGQGTGATFTVEFPLSQIGNNHAPKKS